MTEQIVHLIRRPSTVELADDMAQIGVRVACSSRVKSRTTTTATAEPKLVTCRACYRTRYMQTYVDGWESARAALLQWVIGGLDQ